MFDTARMTYGGESYIVLEYSEDFDFTANFRVNFVAEQIRKSKIPGIIEAIPSIVCLMVHYNPTVIHPQKIMNELKQIDEEARKTEKAEITSRFIEIPVLFNDPASLECQKTFKDRHNTGDIPNIKFVAKENSISVEEVIRRLLKPQFWIVYVGFTPGVSWCAPIGIKKEEMLHASKYKIPRTATPAGTTSIGGIYLAIYSVTSPGGYQLFGRTPVPVVIYDERCNPDKPLKIFKDSVCLGRTSDRLKIRPIDAEEYQKISDQVTEGKYEYYIKEQSFDTKKYFSNPIEYVAQLDKETGYTYDLEERVQQTYSRFTEVL